MFLCSNMCPQHDCFPGFHSKKNSERLEGLFHRRIFLSAVSARHVHKRSRDILLRKSKYAVCRRMNNFVSVRVKAPTDKSRSCNGSRARSKVDYECPLYKLRFGIEKTFRKLYRRKWFFWISCCLKFLMLRKENFWFFVFATKTSKEKCPAGKDEVVFSLTNILTKDVEV